MALRFGGWVKWMGGLGLVCALAGCSVGDLDASAGQPDAGADALDASAFDRDSAARDTGRVDAEAADIISDLGPQVADTRIDAAADSRGDTPDAGAEDASPDLDISDSGAPEPDATAQPDATTFEPDITEPDPCPRLRITAEAGAQIRAGAQSSASVVGTLTQHSVVVVLAQTSGDTVGGSRVWYQIESPRGDGYLPAAAGECTEDAPHIEPPVEPCPNVRVTSSSGVNIRSAPDGSGYVGGLCHGSIVEVVRAVQGKVVEGNDTWYQIRSPNGNGYITGQYADCTTSSTRLTNC